MKIFTERPAFARRCSAVLLGFGLVAVCATAQESAETEERIRIAAANMEDAIVVDCQLPGKLRRLGGMRNYLTPGRLVRTSAIVCRTRGGEYTLGDLASGTLSLQRWMVPAKDGDAEAQYYVARIHANGMDNVPVNYAEAARWYQSAADQGYAAAQQELGFLYEAGLGVEKDVLKALNLQREASGLGDDLDYAYKIADAQALADSLAEQLMVANGALQDSQLQLRQTQDALSSARAGIRQYEVQMVGLVAELAEAEAAAGNGSSTRVTELEAQVADLNTQLEASQTAIIDLESERDTFSAAMSSQLASGQATQLELRELLGRVDEAEGEARSLTTLLAEAQQRLIQSDEELLRLRATYRDESENVTSERARLLEASNRSDSDAQAYVVAAQADVASKAARVASLESRVKKLKAQLLTAGNSAAENSLRDALDTLQVRYDADTAQLRNERDRLQQSYAASEGERSALFAASRQELSERDATLNTQKRQIDTLSAETNQLRARVDTLESQRINASQQNDQQSAQLKAQLSQARQQASSLQTRLDAANVEKAALEAKLLADRMALQKQLVAANAANTMDIELLQAEVVAAESTIKAQNLRIAAMERQIAAGGTQLAALKGQVDESPPAPASDAMQILNMALSPEDPNLGKFHALLIANEEYVNMGRLTTPIRDANEIESLLVDRYGFNVRRLNNATSHEILVALHDYSNSLTENDNLLIYYAGRGSTPDGPPDRAYWQGVDADPDYPNTWVLADYVSDKIKEIAAKRVLLVTDSCFSRRRVQAKTMAIGRGMDPKTFKIMAGFKSRYVLTSGKNVPYLDENGDRTHSMFAKLFMEVLRQNSNVLSGEMLSLELSNRLQERVEDADRATPSYSFLQDAGHKAGDFFFVPKPRRVVTTAGTMGPDTA